MLGVVRSSKDGLTTFPNSFNGMSKRFLSSN